MGGLVWRRFVGVVTRQYFASTNAGEREQERESARESEGEREST